MGDKAKAPKAVAGHARGWYKALEKADAELKMLIKYLKARTRPARLPEGDPMLGAVPFLCAYPKKSPVKIPKLLRKPLRWLVSVGVVPPTKITQAEWAFLMKKVKADEAVGPDGTIYGTKTFEQLDVWWIAALFNSVTTEKWAEFGTTPYVAKMQDTVTIGVLGDWGTGFTPKYAGRNPAKKVMDSLSRTKPDLIVHLGDVYYSGTPLKITFLPPGEEQVNFARCWPKRKPGTSFTLNSNHEMYSKGQGLFGDALKRAAFKHQKKTSYFLLQNRHWQVFGLDSAYASPDGVTFMDGRLEEKQIEWMRKVHDPKRRSIILCHHNALSVYGKPSKACKALWADVVRGLGGKQPDYWYWGHIHNGIVYKGIGRSPAARNATKARCVGHGALPFGFAWGLTRPKTLAVSATGAPPTSFQPVETVEHFAHEYVRKGRPYVKNGFAILRLSGAGICEKFYDEDGVPTWSALD